MQQNSVVYRMVRKDVTLEIVKFTWLEMASVNILQFVLVLINLKPVVHHFHSV